MKAPFTSFLVIALGCLVQAQAETPVQSDFQQYQFTGRWFSIGLASNSSWFQENKQVMKMYTTVVTPTEDGSLEVSSTYPKLDQCETRKTLFSQMEQPGHFSYTSPRSGNYDEFLVVETNYEEYVLLFAKMSNVGETSTMVMLYGRSKQLQADLLEKFTQVALAEGLTQDDILILPRTDLCMAESV
ncbi:lipocalin-like [Elgaria multicarinata webbii]|uniref:lipocalin-like n=1 Tax=Elgaria multicarinata webbii TaxID=159646 RepID=UPI002FCCCE9D